jgi:apolipoprotein N-acyltransferase
VSAAPRPAGGHSLLKRFVLVAAVFLAACAQAVSIAWPISTLTSDIGGTQDVIVRGDSLWWLQLLAQAVLAAFLFSARSARSAGLLLWAGATVWLSAVFWWLYIALNTYGGLPATLSATAVIALAAALALYYGIVGWALWHWRGTSPLVRSLAFAAGWTMAELARGTWLTGFGWGAVGYAHLDGPLAWYLPWFGSYGVGFLAAWVAAALALLARGQWRPALLAVLVLGVPTLLPTAWNHWTHASGTLQVTLLQGNIAQGEKFEASSGIPMALQWYADELRAAQTDLVVAPETAIPMLPEQLPAGYWQALQQHFASTQTTALVGIPLGNFSQGYTNSVLGLAAGQATPWRYDKHHLVPFGEFIPPLFKWFTRMMNIPLGDFNRGGLGQPALAVKGERVAANICYEDLYGEELAVRFANPGQAPTVFANVSNLAWFDDSVAIDQHLNISRARALEFQRSFVRATNTGATAIVDYQAKVVARLPGATQGVLVGTVEGRTGLTPFAWWASRWGLWPIWLVCLGCVAVAWAMTRHARSAGAPVK